MFTTIKRLDSSLSDTFDQLSLLALRLTFGLSLVLLHGLAKFENFSTMVQTFPDPLHLGHSSVSLALVIFAELFCASLVTIGLWTRFAAIPLVFNFCVAFFVIHANDGFDKKTPALMYLVVFAILMLRGAGKLSLDHALKSGGGSGGGGKSRGSKSRA